MVGTTLTQNKNKREMTGSKHADKVHLSNKNHDIQAENCNLQPKTNQCKQNIRKGHAKKVTRSMLSLLGIGSI